MAAAVRGPPHFVGSDARIVRIFISLWRVWSGEEEEEQDRKREVSNVQEIKQLKGFLCHRGINYIKSYSIIRFNIKLKMLHYASFSFSVCLSQSLSFILSHPFSIDVSLISSKSFFLSLIPPFSFFFLLPGILTTNSSYSFSSLFYLKDLLRKRIGAVR